MFLEVYDDVLEQAEEAQKIIDSGNSKELTGIPLAIKDNILIKGKKQALLLKFCKIILLRMTSVIEKLKEEG